MNPNKELRVFVENENTFFGTSDKYSWNQLTRHAVWMAFRRKIDYHQVILEEKDILATKEWCEITDHKQFMDAVLDELRRNP